MRQFVAAAFPDEHGCLTVSEKKYHYLVSVLRVRVGDMILVRLPSQALQAMTVARIDEGARRLLLTIAGGRAESESVPDAPSCELWLFQCVAKPPKMDLIIRQAVECGVAVIAPVAGTFCQKSALESVHKKGEGGRWQRIIDEARQQSGSACATQVLPCLPSVEEAGQLWQRHLQEQGCTALSGSVALALYEQTEGTQPLHRCVGERLAGGAIRTAAVLVGAEGGIAPAELLRAQEYGFTPVHFATNILRCETAALYGMAALQAAVMENAIWQLKK